MKIRNHIDKILKSFEKDFAVYNRIEVSKSALLHNLDLFANLSGQRIIPVLKSNAYGHGIKIVANAIKGRRIPYIAVDSYYEALAVRSVSRQPVLIMGSIVPKNFAHMNYDNFAFVVQDIETINALGKTGRKINIHLECNTGMNRYGIEYDEIAEIIKLILRYDNLTLEGVMSHLADSDGDSQETVNSAVKRFDLCVEAVKSAGINPKIIHVAQSAGSLKTKSKYANTIRLGIGLYGINPFRFGHKLHHKLDSLRPALRLISTITKVVELDAGDKVGYNYTFTASAKTRIGVLPLGYYEGVNRALSNVGKVKIGNKFVPIAGRICMNCTMIDLAGSNAQKSDEIIIYSNNRNDINSIDRIAFDYKLFNYNLLTSLSKDIRRVLVD